MLDSAIAKDQTGAERRPTAGIAAAPNRAHFVAAGIKAGDRPVIRTEHLCITVGLQADGRAESRRVDFHREEWAVFYRAEIGIGLDAIVAEHPVVWIVALAKIQILAGFAEFVVPRDGGFQRDRVDADLARQFAQGAAGDDVAALEVFAQARREGPDNAEAALPDEATVADQMIIAILSLSYCWCSTCWPLLCLMTYNMWAGR